MTLLINLDRVLDFLHSKGIIHRDIKPENLLLCKKKSGRHVLKLADFGWSVVKRETTGFYRTTLCGTLDYLSPEIVNVSGLSTSPLPRSPPSSLEMRHKEHWTPVACTRCMLTLFILQMRHVCFGGCVFSALSLQNEEYDEAVDRWTLGVLMYEFLLGVAPFMAEDQESTFDRIAGANVCFPADATISEEAKDLIRQVRHHPTQYPPHC